MRFVHVLLPATGSTPAAEVLALQHQGELRALPEAARAQLPADLALLLGAGPEALREAEALLRREGRPLPTEGLRYRPPVARPPKILCIGLNYRDHAAEAKLALPTSPTVFARFASSLTAHGEPIVRPRASVQLDYEAELVACIGRGGRHIPREQALAHVAGYTLCNEASVRDFQLRSTQWTLGKNFDATAAMGPAFVSADELPAGGAGLAVRTRLNGVLVQDGNTCDMVFDVATLVAALSEVMTLQPGDLISTGTPAGVGMARTPPLWLKAGDLVEVEIEGLGLLRNPVVDEA